MIPHQSMSLIDCFNLDGNVSTKPLSLPLYLQTLLITTCLFLALRSKKKSIPKKAELKYENRGRCQDGVKVLILYNV